MPNLCKFSTDITLGWVLVGGVITEKSTKSLMEMKGPQGKTGQWDY